MARQRSEVGILLAWWVAFGPGCGSGRATDGGCDCGDPGNGSCDPGPAGDAAPDASGDPRPAPADVPADVAGDPGPAPAGCAAWEADLAVANLASLRRFALDRAVSVVEATIAGAPVPAEGRSWVPIRIDAVRRGWSFLAGTEVRVEEYEHLPRHLVKVAFRCGDSRLRVPGARWVAPLVLLDPWSWTAGDPPPLDRAFLIPGVLLPESEVGPQLEASLAHFWLE